MPDANVTRNEISLTEAEASALRRSAYLADSLPEVNRELDGMTRSTMTKAFKAIRAGTLTPQEAMSYWMELFSYDRLSARLNEQAAVARTVTETHRR